MAYEKIAKILGITPQLLKEIDEVMTEKSGRRDILQKISDLNERTITATLAKIGSSLKGADEVRGALRQAIFNKEKQLLTFLENIPGADEFEKAVNLAKKIGTAKSGFFLKKSYLEKILKERPSQKLLDYLGFRDADELIKNADILEVFSALRFIESDEWMHETFEEVYSNFKSSDFEERPIELKVLGAKWLEVSKKFIAKKHHNVSHLKEFGVIFLNPVKEDIPGKFLRDFALLLHYFHEVDFYSKLFQQYSREENFAERLKSLLRGDVLAVKKVKPGEWLIVQRYLAKENPNDSRLLLPRVNPESMHWRRGERDLANFALRRDDIDLELWYNLDWIGGFFEEGKREEFVSFDLEDNAMSAVSFIEGKNQFFTYHQKEALWTKIFEEYAGGEDKMEKLLVENFERGIIRF